MVVVQAQQSGERAGGNAGIHKNENKSLSLLKPASKKSSGYTARQETLSVYIPINMYMYVGIFYSTCIYVCMYIRVCVCVVLLLRLFSKRPVS